MNTKTNFVVRIGNFLMVATLSAIMSCGSEQIESPILVFLSPEAATIEANSNDHVFITIESRSQSGQHLRLQIETVDVLYGVRTTFDSTFRFKNIHYLYDFVVPAYPDSTGSLLVFKLSNDVGDQIQIAKRLFINKGASSVKEASGNITYSTLSNKPSGYSLQTMVPIYLADSLTKPIDIIDASGKNQETNGSLSRIWQSRTNLLFVKFNGFNYPQANAITISNSYKSGIKLSRISGLQDGDILIVGKGNKALGAIQVISITDLSGVENDKYVFSVKKLD
jgi:hypothetical protein